MNSIRRNSWHIAWVFVCLISFVGYPALASGLSPLSNQNIDNSGERDSVFVPDFLDQYRPNDLDQLKPANSIQTIIEATMAGNVADSNLDGLGDNHNSLPGPAPVLISAGVDVSGGAGSNGTVRMQFEWPLESLASDTINSATVILYTNMGSVDMLDTYFYHGTSDQDGILSDSDFEAPVSLIPAVVMPVSTAETFMFDVTDYLKADAIAGNNFFSVQGRVDESLIGSGFKRGLQVRSTATTTPTELRPQLVVTYCYALTLAHTGSGDDPDASPTNSAGCPPGEYTAEAIIELTANPASGWHVGSWSGTGDDSSTSSINSVSMPASAHIATVNYEEDAPTCYALTRTHTGSGADPTASPTNSPGCPAGQYTAGTLINLAASPSSGWHVGSWSGTGDDLSTSTSNSVSMPASDHTAIVNYIEDTYLLNLPVLFNATIP